MNQDEYFKALEEQKRAEELKKQVLFNFMTKEARERFKRVEMVHPSVANNTLMIILQGIQTGRLRMIDDKTLKSILESISQNKTNYNIKM